MYTCMTVITYVAIGDKTKKAGYNIEAKHTKHDLEDTHTRQTIIIKLSQ